MQQRAAGEIARAVDDGVDGGLLVLGAADQLVEGIKEILCTVVIAIGTAHFNHFIVDIAEDGQIPQLVDGAFEVLEARDQGWQLVEHLGRPARAIAAQGTAQLVEITASRLAAEFIEARQLFGHLF